MKRTMSAALLLAAMLTAGPVLADEGAGGPVPGLGPGGAGATGEAVSPSAVPLARRGSPVALYRDRRRHAHR